MSLKGIKTKIRGIDKTHKVTKAMGAVSAVKMRKSQERALKGRPYAVAALSILRRVGGSRDAMHHPLLLKRPLKKLCVIVITSDKGLAGGLNSYVVRAVEGHIERSGISKESVGIIAMGRKGYDYFSKRGYTILQNIQDVQDKVTIEEVRTVTEDIIKSFLDKSYDNVVVVYSHFKSTFEQNATVRQVLPLSIEGLAKTIHDIVPKSGKYAEEKKGERQELYTVEPDHETVLNALIPHLLQIKLYHSLLEAKASEHSARMVAMKNASDKARDLSKELTLSFNKARQAQITREVSEIVGGIEAMS